MRTYPRGLARWPSICRRRRPNAATRPSDCSDQIWMLLLRIRLYNLQPWARSRIIQPLMRCNLRPSAPEPRLAHWRALRLSPRYIGSGLGESGLVGTCGGSTTSPGLRPRMGLSLRDTRKRASPFDDPFDPAHHCAALPSPHVCKFDMFASSAASPYGSEVGIGDLRVQAARQQPWPMAVQFHKSRG
ncbi:hypothetical protein CCHR01_18841 [Colletotrichum chrysophilum]|uniref:Uncharacterized protein n=1 Tax=Colletotrichum chrysophilum TaxID=1836956 RepID=A0AAD9A1N8_9PEZI|nr:hypothetical protein CCHR01_18841 [Colletotrichum chrysophilum]